MQNVKRLPLWRRFPSPEKAAKYLIDKRGLSTAARYSRDKEAEWGTHAEWWGEVHEAIMKGD